MWTSNVVTSCFYRPKRSFGQGNIFTGVCLSTGGGYLQIFRGVPFFGGGTSKFSEGVPFFGGVPPNFRGGAFLGGVPPNFRGGTSKFSGGYLQIFGGVPFWGGVPQNTVNVRPVRILLECILVFFLFFFCIPRPQRFTLHSVVVTEINKT